MRSASFRWCSSDWVLYYTMDWEAVEHTTPGGPRHHYTKVESATLMGEMAAL